MSRPFALPSNMMHCQGCGNTDKRKFGQSREGLRCIHCGRVKRFGDA